MSARLDAQYHIQVDDDSDFRSPEINETYADLNAYTLAGIPGATYYWRVKAVNREYGYPESEWSEVWTVTINVYETYLPLVVRE